jgi:acid phosphatase (class A)
MNTRQTMWAAGAVALAAALAGSVAVGLSVAQDIPRVGYLGQTGLDTTGLIGAPPAPGSVGAEADRAIFRATRALKGSARWDMAVADFNERAVIGNMSCAIGVQINLATMPATTKLILHMAPDVTRAAYGPKKAFLRPRPYKVDPGETCGVLPATEDAYDYPSGHAAWGWATGLVFAEMLPGRSVAILKRARAVGTGRAVCGVHNASSVEAGQIIGAAVVAAEHGSPEFRADLEAAKAELAAAVAAGPAPTGCEAQAAALETPPW